MKPKRHKIQKERREEIKERDNYTCQRCGEKTKKLDIHHKSRAKNKEDKKADYKSNLISVCRSCHQQLHKKDISKGLTRK